MGIKNPELMPILNLIKNYQQKVMQTGDLTFITLGKCWAYNILGENVSFLISIKFNIL
jgi:hypothetical protein